MSWSSAACKPSRDTISMRSAALHCQEESAFIRARVGVCVCVCAGLVGARAVSLTPSESARGSEGPISWTFCLNCCHMLQQGEKCKWMQVQKGAFNLISLFLLLRNVLKLDVVDLGWKTVGLFERFRDIQCVCCAADLCDQRFCG